MNQIELVQLLNEQIHFEGLKVGLSKYDFEQILDKNLSDPAIETPDLTLFYIKLKSGITLSCSFDLSNICFDITIDFELNESLKIVFQDITKEEQIDKDSSFDWVISMLAKAKTNWEFDRKRIYRQTCCIRIKNGLRLFYAFGDKKGNDFGLFEIRSISENHPLTTLN
jgi:hypothetical protein